MSGFEADLLCAEPSFPTSARIGPRQSRGLRIETKAAPECVRRSPSAGLPSSKGGRQTRRKVACSEEVAASS
jgi:hypothetical protein